MYIYACMYLDYVSVDFGRDVCVFAAAGDRSGSLVNLLSPPPSSLG